MQPERVAQRKSFLPYEGRARFAMRLLSLSYTPPSGDRRVSTFWNKFRLKRHRIGHARRSQTHHSKLHFEATLTTLSSSCHSSLARCTPTSSRTPMRKNTYAGITSKASGRATPCLAVIPRVARKKTAPPDVPSIGGRATQG